MKLGPDPEEIAAQNPGSLSGNRGKENLEYLQNHEHERRQEAKGQNRFPGFGAVCQDILKVEENLGQQTFAPEKMQDQAGDDQQQQ